MTGVDLLGARVCRERYDVDSIGIDIYTYFREIFHNEHVCALGSLFQEGCVLTVNSRAEMAMVVGKEIEWKC